ncbi:MAG: NUDIX hydrolase [Myxococcales bacterium]|nr:NUDIX hydrolase [Myxococcales bacterium]MCB9732904.1 NUDIX hydrolase [Deltaproteobacteria bacterium]
MTLPEAVAVVVRRADGRRLMVKRAPGRPAPGYWTPVTGRIEAGESSDDAGAREVLEEVGLRVVVGPRVHEGLTAGGGFRLLWHEATVADPVPALVLASDEVAEARWLTLPEILALSPMFAETRSYFERALASEVGPR